MGIGPLAYHVFDRVRLSNTKVQQFFINEQWNEGMIRQHAPPIKILQTKVHYNANVPDKANWRLSESGQFTVASAWEIIR